MTALAERLRRTIRLTGPMTVADYMATVLSDPDHGYYAGDNDTAVIGAGGDFVTAPEISQMFGELIGLWCAESWQAMGAPDRVIVVELGPGRGTLLADALRATRSVPGFAAAIELHLVETSPALRNLQKAALGDAIAHWHTDITTLPAGPMLLIANEFFDALPVHQYVANGELWCERLVGADTDGALIFIQSPGPTPGAALMRALGAAATAGAVAEVCPAALSLAGTIGRRLVETDGAALIIDYGRSGMIGDSFQAVRCHQFKDVLAEPGRSDLSTLVDFTALARAASETGAAVHGPVDQGSFLRSLGIEMRAAALMESATPEQANDIETALERLVAPDQMGTLFKALAITSPGQTPPPGLAA